MLRRFVSGLVWGGVVAGLGLAVISQVAPRSALTAGPATPDVLSVLPDVAADPVAPATAGASETDAAAAETVLSQTGEPDAAPAPAIAATVASVVADTGVDGPLPDVKAAAPAANDAANDATSDTAITTQSTAPADLTNSDPAQEMAARDQATRDILPDAPPSAVGDEPLLSPAPKAGDAPGALQPAPPPTKVAQDLPRLLTPQTDPGPPGELALALPETQPGSSTLPQIGEAPAAAAGEALPEAAVIDDLPPIAAFARPFDNADAKPLFAILLVDDGRSDVDRTALAALPFPVTFVVDPQSPDAAANAALYRAGLQEVVMVATGLPDDAAPADIERSFEANAAILPETVAVVDVGPQGQLEDRDTAAAVVPILQDQGRGLITYDIGLNAADQAARRAGLPTVELFRVLDGDGESQPTIRRYLDRAAFKAAQEGKVVVMGSTRPETVAAILEWTVEGRAASVALAPVTAVLSAP